MLSICFSLLVACLVVVAENVTKQNPDVIKWQDLNVLWLQNGDLTRGSVPRPQMTALHGSDELNNVICITAGQVVKQKKNFPPVEWSCVPDELPWASKMSVKQVSCECYDLCREDYILIGSCSLAYTVSADFTSSGVIGLFVGTVVSCTYLLYSADKYRRLRRELRENSREPRR